jgi:serine/threonine-protein kinase
MGSVWVADHLALKTEVVVKFMSKELAASPDAVARFSREAAAAARVKSPHVVQTFDHGLTSSGVPYIVMELLEGADLAAHLERRGRLSPSEVSALYVQIGKALGKAHAVGIVHRDIKPDNIFLCDGDAGEVFVKILDFGIAKADAQLGSNTSTGQIMGTPFYMSPEQILAHKDIDLRADVWALGVVAFECLTGQRPYDGESVGALTLAIHNTETPRPSSRNPALPRAFDAWFAKACAIAPDARFSSAKEASQALALALGERVPEGPNIVVEAGAVASAAAATILSSERAIELAEARPPRRAGPVVVGAVLSVAVVIGVLSLLVRTTPEPAPAPPSAIEPAALSTVAPALPALPNDAGLAMPAPKPAIPIASARVVEPRPVAHAPARAAFPPKKVAAAPAESASPPPAALLPPPMPRGSDDDIK